MLYLIGNHNDNFTNHASCQASCKYYLYGDIEFLSKISTGFMFLLLQSINYCSATFCFQPLESEIWLQHMQHYGESPGLFESIRLSAVDSDTNLLGPFQATHYSLPEGQHLKIRKRSQLTTIILLTRA